MPPDHTPRDTEPAHGADAEGAGSVVVGLDPAGIALARVQLDTTARNFRAFHDCVARSAPAVREAMQSAGEAVRDFGRSWERARSTAYEFGGTPSVITDSADAMRWSPPADGEETPPCPA